VSGLCYEMKREERGVKRKEGRKKSEVVWVCKGGN
jgi:hypothetical protein